MLRWFFDLFRPSLKVLGEKDEPTDGRREPLDRVEAIQYFVPPGWLFCGRVQDSFPLGNDTIFFVQPVVYLEGCQTGQSQVSLTGKTPKGGVGKITGARYVMPGGQYILRSAMLWWSPITADTLRGLMGAKELNALESA